jgi:hypothetical protein
MIQILAEKKKFFLLQSIATGSGAHTVSSPMGAGGKAA